MAICKVRTAGTRMHSHTKWLIVMTVLLVGFSLFALYLSVQIYYDTDPIVIKIVTIFIIVSVFVIFLCEFIDAVIKFCNIWNVIVDCVENVIVDCVEVVNWDLNPIFVV
jgi:hypothetical protein